MKFALRLILVALFFSSVHVGAASVAIGGPATGLWSHPGDGGRGFNIDLQGDTMIVTTFVYEATGVPVWYLSSGTYNHQTGVFRSTYDSYTGGQCFGCAANQPLVHPAAAGNLTITFHSTSDATLTFPGGTLAIEKFNYGFAARTDLLRGEWALSYNISGLVGGDWVIFQQLFTGTDGKIYAGGYAEPNSNHLAVGRYDEELGKTIVLVQIGNFQDFYVLDMYDHRALGAAWVLRSGAGPTGNGSPSAGGRLLFDGELTRARSTAKQAAESSADDRTQFVSKESKLVEPKIATRALQMQRALEDFVARTPAD